MNKVRILCADSSGISRAAFSQIIEQQPDMVIIGMAADGLEAVELACSLAPDLVILDITLQKISGIETARRILEHHPGIRIVAWTLHNERRFVDVMLKAGVSGYVLKDSATDVLLTAIRQAATGQSYVDANVRSPGIVQPG